MGLPPRSPSSPCTTGRIARGLDELARVARIEIDHRIFPTFEDFRHALGPVEVEPLPIPHDCVDGFLGAYWRRPHAYLDAGVRGAISTFAKLHDVGRDLGGLERLRRDLADRMWERRYADLLTRTEIDLGYRIVIGAKR
jgi:hypothetical protein